MKSLFPQKSIHPEWSPEYIVEWASLIRRKHGENYAEELLRDIDEWTHDTQMRAFWYWLGTVQSNGDGLRSGLEAIRTIRRATRLPTKPSNYPPAQRAAYLEKVRKHADALRTLLEATKFDRLHESELSDIELDRTLNQSLQSWGIAEEEEGHIVAFRVTRDGKFKLHFAYPSSDLTNLLWEVTDWTHWEDQWDGALVGSSASIVQANAATARVVYFTCSVFDWFSSHGGQIPFPVLASVANVALSLGPDELVDEDTVRKQVRRHQARVKQSKLRAPQEPEVAGHNSQDFGDFVLSDRQ